MMFVKKRRERKGMIIIDKRFKWKNMGMREIGGIRIRMRIMGVEMGRGEIKIKRGKSKNRIKMIRKKK
jgi:hypothetical protein